MRIGAIRWPVKRSISCSIRRSRGVTKRTATPARPARPVRPMRWTYASTSWGMSKFTTWLMRSTSMPRAATSVATTISTAPLLKPLDHPFAQRLAHVAMERPDRVAAGLELLGDLRRRGLRAREDEHRLGRLGLEQAGQGVELLPLRDVQVPLLDRRHGERRPLGLDRHRVFEVPLGDAADRGRHGGREERGLPPRLGAGRLLEDPLDVVDEAHAQHLVGLVEHHHAEPVEAQRAAPQVIHDPAGGADDHVHAALEPPLLALDRLAAVDR